MSLDWQTKPCIYNIPAGTPFLDALAAGICKMAEQENDPLALARMEILLPTRRACRALRDTFLKITQGTPLLLPRMHPIGDVDEEELSLVLSAESEALDVPPALPALQRQFLLMQMISAVPGYSHSIERDIQLAAALARLMDQIYTEDLSLENLALAVDQEAFAAHWQVSLKFLSILGEHWPRILEENGVIDAADRRNRLLKKLQQRWQESPPAHPVIAAGSTGSIPATGALLKTIAHMPKGCIVLPGLDQTMDAASWNALDPSHPQASLKHLIGVLDQPRDKIALWPYGDAASGSSVPALMTEIMRPAETAQEWQKLKNTPVIEAGQITFERYDLATPQEEALVIATALRDALETPRSTAALVTPDRKLARRVAMACRRWGIEVDDSAGMPLAQTQVGLYIRSLMDAVIEDYAPVALLSFLKNGLCQPKNADNWRSRIRDLDRTIMRGPFFHTGFEGHRRKLEQRKTQGRSLPAHAQATYDLLEILFAPLIELTRSGQRHSAKNWTQAHLQVAENFSHTQLLWTGEAGECAANFFAQWMEHASLLPSMTAREYLATLEQAMNGLNVRPRYGLHPRISILGQMEARLVQNDLMILGGLNEKSWPPDPGNDPWMSRPMRTRFGLPPLEQAVGLSAHDFVQAVCAPRVILTRALRTDGTPTVPARWLQRLDTVLEACGIPSGYVQRGTFKKWAESLDKTIGTSLTYERPQPRPPVSVRPRELPVTQIEKWLQDPYSLYAREILRLKKLDSLEQKMDAALRGTLIHTALDRFVQETKNSIPANAQDRFLTIAKEEIGALGLGLDALTWWEPRLQKIAGWLVQEEKKWRVDFIPHATESQGKMVIDAPAGPFTLTARADRIDICKDGQSAAIIDYKSGGSFTLSGMQDGRHPQLPLEAIILETGGFAGLNSNTVTDLSYWIVNGSKEGGVRTSLIDSAKLADAKQNAYEGLTTLVNEYDNASTPYYSLPRPRNAPRFNDYEYLARVKEWTALDDPEEAA